MAAPPSPPGDVDVERLATDLCPALFAWTRLRLPEALRNVVSAEDVVQEVWVRVIQLWRTRDDTSHANPRAWVFAIAKHVLMEVQRRAMRSARRGNAPGGTDAMAAFHAIPESITSLTRRVARQDDVRQVLGKVAELDEDDRMLLLYCGMEAMTHHDAAQRLGISVEATSKRWQRLTERVREWGITRGLLAV